MGQRSLRHGPAPALPCPRLSPAWFAPSIWWDLLAIFSSLHRHAPRYSLCGSTTALPKLLPVATIAVVHLCPRSPGRYLGLINRLGFDTKLFFRAQRRRPCGGMHEGEYSLQKPVGGGVIWRDSWRSAGTSSPVARHRDRHRNMM